jgi:hypothetical protein
MLKSKLVPVAIGLLALCPSTAATQAPSIPPESISSRHILDIPRNVSFSAASLIVDPTSSVIRPFGSTGLLWNPDFSRDARVVLTRPGDFSGGDNLRFTVYFQPTNAQSGAVSFFVRPASFNAGDSEFDPRSVEAAPVPVSGSGSLGFAKIYKQVFTLPLSAFGKEIWMVKIQRNTGSQSVNTDTYPFPVVVWGASISYRAKR